VNYTKQIRAKLNV